MKIEQCARKEPHQTHTWVTGGAASLRYVVCPGVEAPVPKTFPVDEWAEKNEQPSTGVLKEKVTLRHPNGSVLVAERLTRTLSPEFEPFILSPGIWSTEKALLESGYIIVPDGMTVRFLDAGGAVVGTLGDTVGPYFDGEGPNQSYNWTGTEPAEDAQEEEFPEWLMRRLVKAMTGWRDFQLDGEDLDPGLRGAAYEGAAKILKALQFRPTYEGSGLYEAHAYEGQKP